MAQWLKLCAADLKVVSLNQYTTKLLWVLEKAPSFATSQLSQL